MRSVPKTPLKIPLENESTTRATRARLAGNLGVLIYFVILVCLSQVEVIFGGHSASASVFFGHFTYNAAPRSPLIDNAEGFVRQSLDYLGVGLITHGHSPWWNPYAGLGSPLAQDWSSAIFYPVSFVVEWLHLDSTGIDVTALTDMVVAGVCAYWLGRVLGLRRVAALVAGTAFCLGGSFVWGGSLFANVAAWTPASLALTVRLLDPRGPRRRDVVLLAGVTGIQVLGGYPELFVLQYVLLTLPLGLACLLRLREGRIRGALAVIEGVGVGVAATAFLWVPFASALHSEVIWNRAGEAVRHLPVWVDLVFLAPFAFGRFFNHPLSLLDWFTIGGYVGGVAAWLALAATFGWRRRPWVVVPFAISAVMAIMLINGTAPLAWVGKLPVLTVVPLARLSFLSLALAVAVLAAVAVDRSPSLMAWVAATVGLGGSVLYLFAIAPSQPRSLAVLFPALSILALAMLWFAIRHAPRIFKSKFGGRIPGWASSAMVLGVLAVELLVVSNVNWDISTPTGSAFGAPQWVSYVRSHLGNGRLYTANSLLYPSYAGDFGIRSVSFEDGIAPKRTVAFYTKEIGNTIFPFGSIGLDYKATLADHMQGLELAGVTMVALPDPGCAPACDHLKLLDVDRPSSVGVFAVPSPQPMVWLPATAVTGTGVPGAPLYAAAVPAGSGVATGPQGAVGGLAMTGDNARIVVHVDTFQARLLVLRQVDFPGWTASIDGRSARIVLVDGVFDGVVVPAGESMVVFSYVPPGLPLGVAISLIALLWVGAGALFVVWKRRKQSSQRKDPTVFSIKRRSRDGGSQSASAAGPSGRLPLSSLTNVDAWGDKRWMELFDDLGTYSHDVHIFGPRQPPNVHRKGWEWVQTIYGLDRLGMIRPQHRAIGVGAGRECVIFWLADRISHVVATDLYGNDTWTSTGGHEADAAVLENPQQFCPRPIRLEALEFKVMDGTDLGFYGDETFDIAWSLSSIEHFGSHENSAKAVREMARVVKPGGVVVIATECLLLPEQTHDEFFSRSDMETYVIGASPQLELVEEMDWKWPPPEYLLDAVVFPQQAERLRRHIVLNDGIVQWTSVLAFFRRI